MQSIRVERQIGGRTLSIETGSLAKLADGSVSVQYADTVVFGAVVRANPREGIDFFPLQVDYRERRAAAGKFAGGFLKREGRPTTKEILTARLTDRPLRPLFPKGYKDEIQIQANVMSVDAQNEPDVLCITGASASLMIAPVPFQGPIAGVRVGLIDGNLILMPTNEQIKNSALDLVVAGSQESVLMIEGFGKQIPEAEMLDAIMFAHKHIVT